MQPAFHHPIDTPSSSGPATRSSISSVLGNERIQSSKTGLVQPLKSFRWSLSAMLFLLALLPGTVRALPTLVLQSVVVRENVGQVSIKVDVINGEQGTFTARVRFRSLSTAVFFPATAGADFTERTFPLLTNAGNNSSQLFIAPIQINNDTAIEPDESFGVELFDVVGATNGGSVSNWQAFATIVDDDNNPSPRVSNVTVTEPTQQFGLIQATFTVTLQRPSANFTFVDTTHTSDVTVAFATREGTADSSTTFLLARDFEARSGTFTIPAGAPSGTFTVSVRGDGRTLREPTENFFVDVSTPNLAQSNVIEGPALPSYRATGTGTILDAGDFSGLVRFTTGVFELSSETGPNDRVPVDEVVNYKLVWTVPEGEVWRNLNTIDFRIRDGGDIALWVRWDETANTFSLCEQDRKHRRHGKGCRDDDDDAENRDADVIVGPGALPGSATVLETPYARFHLDGTTVVGSGPTGPTVTLNLAVSFKRKAAGHGYKVKLAATDDLGHEDDFITVTKVFVESIKHR